PPAPVARAKARCPPALYRREGARPARRGDARGPPGRHPPLGAPRRPAGPQRALGRDPRRPAGRDPPRRSESARAPLASSPPAGFLISPPSFLKLETAPPTRGGF